MVIIFDDKKKICKLLQYNEIKKRPTGIEPASSAWKAEVITIIPQAQFLIIYNNITPVCQGKKRIVLLRFLVL